MSATALRVIERAARRIEILAEEEALSSAGAADALTTLNDLLFGFPARGINYTHTALVLTDNLAFPDRDIRSVMMLLAVELAADYGQQIADMLKAQAVQAEQQLQAAYPPTMDATVLGLINQALNRLRVFAGSGNGGPALPFFFISATASADAVRTFNDMMHGLGTRGIKYAHTTLASSATVNMPDEQIRNLVLLLMKEFANVYAVPLPAQAMVEINRAEGALQGAYWVQPPAQTDPLLRPPSRSFDMTRGQ